MEKKTGSLKERFNNTNDYSFLEKEARCEGEGNVNYRHFDARIDAASLKQYEEFYIRDVCRDNFCTRVGGRCSDVDLLSVWIIRHNSNDGKN